MPVSNTQDVANTQETPEAVELTVTQLDEVTGGDGTITTTVSTTKQASAIKNAEATRALL